MVAFLHRFVFTDTPDLQIYSESLQQAIQFIQDEKNGLIHSYGSNNSPNNCYSIFTHIFTDPAAPVFAQSKHLTFSQVIPFAFCSINRDILPRERLSLTTKYINNFKRSESHVLLSQ